MKCQSRELRLQLQAGHRMARCGPFGMKIPIHGTKRIGRPVSTKMRGINARPCPTLIPCREQLHAAMPDTQSLASECKILMGPEPGTFTANFRQFLGFHVSGLMFNCSLIPNPVHQSSFSHPEVSPEAIGDSALWQTNQLWPRRQLCGW